MSNPKEGRGRRARKGRKAENPTNHHTINNKVGEGGTEEGTKGPTGTTTTTNTTTTTTCRTPPGVQKGVGAGGNKAGRLGWVGRRHVEEEEGARGRLGRAGLLGRAQITSGDKGTRLGEGRGKKLGAGGHKGQEPNQKNTKLPTVSGSKREGMQGGCCCKEGRRVCLFTIRGRVWKVRLNKVARLRRGQG